MLVRNVHTSGGHFAALESPDILLADIKEFWKKGGLGGLQVKLDVGARSGVVDNLHGT